MLQKTSQTPANFSNTDLSKIRKSAHHLISQMYSLKYPSTSATKNSPKITLQTIMEVENKVTSKWRISSSNLLYFPLNSIFFVKKALKSLNSLAPALSRLPFFDIDSDLSECTPHFCTSVSTDIVLEHQYWHLPPAIKCFPNNQLQLFCEWVARGLDNGLISGPVTLCDLFLQALWNHSSVVVRRVMILDPRTVPGQKVKLHLSMWHKFWQIHQPENI